LSLRFKYSTYILKNLYAMVSQPMSRYPQGGAVAVELSSLSFFLWFIVYFNFNV
jgi:hypothetical protein